MGSERGGGQNKTHGTVEQHPAIDSFSISKLPIGKHTHLTEDGTDVIVVLMPKQMHISFLYFNSENKSKCKIAQKIVLFHLENNFGGKPRTYFLCPHCCVRTRFLFCKEEVFQCRMCAKLNYTSQQLTRGLHSSIYRMEQVLQKGFGIKNAPAPIDACRLTPDKPKRMRWETYQKRLRSLREAQALFEDALLKKVAYIHGK